MVETYVKNTGPSGFEKRLLHVWKMDREGEVRDSSLNTIILYGLWGKVQSYYFLTAFVTPLKLMTRRRKKITIFITERAKVHL